MGDAGDPPEPVVDVIAGRTSRWRGSRQWCVRPGRNEPIKSDPEAFAADTYLAVDADSERPRDVLSNAPLVRRRPQLSGFTSREST